ncbi:MAG TPA: YbaK/EbsC family protein, partial [Thermoanaerobacterales bacterium]|nr:YbaK/EbsC family protein [Thermoanaerobacterales bacterium]
AGDVKIDSKKFKKIFSERPNLAKPKEVEEITGYPIGGVCPFAMEKPIDVYLDTSLKRFDVVYAAAGTPSSSLPITMEELKIVTKGDEIDVSKF